MVTGSHHQSEPTPLNAAGKGHNTKQNFSNALFWFHCLFNLKKEEKFAWKSINHLGLGGMSVRLQGQKAHCVYSSENERLLPLLHWGLVPDRKPLVDSLNFIPHSSLCYVMLNPAFPFSPATFKLFKLSRCHQFKNCTGLQRLENLFSL